MDIESIEAQGKRLDAALNEVHDRQTAWHAKQREVTQVLTKVVNLPSLKPHSMLVRVDEGTITLDFGKQPSGIPRQGSIKEGGALAFTQVSTGIVWALVYNPSIKGVREATAPDIIAQFLPNQIREEAVLETVSKFLDIVIGWELGRKED